MQDPAFVAEGGAVEVEDDRGKQSISSTRLPSSVYESACCTGESETDMGMRDLKSKKNY